MSFSAPPYNLKQSFDLVRFHSILFVLFLLSLPFSIRKVFGVFSPDGSFNEYLDISLYLSDILLIATVVVFILENKRTILSIIYWRKMFHVEHLLLSIFIPILFVLWSGLSIFWSENISLAMIAFSHLAEGYLIYLYILICNVPRGTFMNEDTQNKIFHVENREYYVENSKSEAINVPRGTFMNMLYNYISQCSTWNILQTTLTILIISGFFQSIVAILQFIGQQSLGLNFLKESAFNPHNLGIAKIVIDKHIFIRSYGFFPHPNILGGFLAISLLITMVYPLVFKSKMFHVEHFMGVWLYRTLIFIQLLALSFTFSKSAVTAFVIGFIILVFGLRKMFHVEHFYTDKQRNVPRGTSQNLATNHTSEYSLWEKYSRSVTSALNKMFHVEHLFVIGGIIIVGMLVASINLKLFIVQPFVERLFYMASIKPLFKVYYFEGLGIGQFVFDMQHFFTEKLLFWQLQPIHNVFLLIFSEVGLVGLGLFLWFLVFVFLKNDKSVPRGTFQSNNKKVIISYLTRSLLIVIVFIMFFDHYFWDIQQGQLLLWIIFALAVSDKKY